MVNKCSVFGCFTNHSGHEAGTVFGLKSLKDQDQKAKWIKFINRRDINVDGCVFVCEKHFEERFMRRNEKQPRLIKEMLPVPTIHPAGVYDEKPSCIPTTPTASRKPPTQRVYQQDEMAAYKATFNVRNFDDVNESLLEFLPPGYIYEKFEDHVVFSKIERDEFSVPTFTETIRIDNQLHVRLFSKSSPVPLPPWFRKGTECKFTSKDMLSNFVLHIHQENEKWGDVLDEIQRIRYMKTPVYSAKLLRYSLMLRYTSLQAYRLMMEEFKLPSLALLRKITTGNIDTIKSAKMLKANGNISEDVILMLDEMYLQKCEEYSGGKSYGANEEGELFKGVMGFMIVGLQSSVPYIVKTLPETQITGDFVKEALLDCLTTLHESGFNVRGVVSDDHSTNVSAYTKLLVENGKAADDLFVTLNGRKIYLFFDTVHLIKNVRNNLLNKKRFLFPEFNFNDFYDPVKVKGGELSWGLLHKVHEQDAKLTAHLKAAPKLTSKVLHPGNCKQSVPVALAVFDETTSAAIDYYFPEKDDASGFLKLFHKWFTISNSKQRYNSHNRLGNAAVENDEKPKFLRAFADWLKKWDEMKLPNCEKFTLSAQTSSALKRTLRCHAALIEDLLREGYQYVLTARFQSDPLERRFGQYRQMSGGRFLVSLKDVECSEKILKIKSLLREGIDIDEDVKVIDDYTAPLTKMNEEIDLIIRDVGRLSLSPETKDISNHVAGYVAVKLQASVNGCCGKRLINDGENSDNYHKKLSRGGLTVASEALENYVATGFSILDACETTIVKSGIPSRIAGEFLLKKYLSVDEYGFACTGHESETGAKIIRRITNVFFNNKRKCSTDAVTDDRVKKFKSNKRTKSRE